METSFDFIIIGGGTAGCTLANRLSASPSTRVLVLEAGGRDYFWDLRIHMPAALSMPMGNPKLDWCYQSEPEPFLEGRRVAHARGKVLGGSSSINGMIFQRGNPLDYEDWAREPGMNAWSYAHCLPYFKRFENQFAQSQQLTNEVLVSSLNYRGHAGPLNVEQGPCTTPLYQAFFDAVKQAGYQQVADLNGFRQEGFAAFDRTVFQGARQSAAKCFFHPIKHRQNVQLLCHAHVVSLDLVSNQVKAVRVQQGRRSLRFEAKHVIVSAGAFNTPALLQRSGIGPASVLSKASVPVKHDLPGVGENLQDHLEVYIQHRCKEPVSMQWALSKWRQPFVGLQWLLSKKGAASSNHFEAGGFIRSHQASNRPDIMIHFLPLAVRYDGSAPIKGDGYQLHIGPTLSNARGKLWIKSADHRQPPAFVFNYLSTEKDRQQWLAAIRKARHLLSQPAWAELDGGEISPGHKIDSLDDVSILNWVKRESETALHPAGTCKLGTDNLSVVEPNTFAVHGIKGLYVVDASLMPTITNANLSAPVYMMAEKASDALLGNTPLLPEKVDYYKNSAVDKRTVVSGCKDFEIN